MNIFRGCGGRSSSKAGDFGLRKLFVYAIFFSLFSQVYTFVIEYGLTSLNELNKNRNGWYTPQGGSSPNIDLSRGGQVAFVPAFGGGYGFYNRGYPQGQINLILPKSKDSSSEEHEHKRKRHRPSSEDHSDYEPKHHPKHHESPKEELNNEHAEQAELSAHVAESLNRIIDFKKSQLGTHAQMRDEELSRGNEDAAKKEQAIIDIYQDQIKYLEGIQKAEEAIAAGEAEMYYDDDGAGKNHGHHKGGQGHHPHHKGHKKHEPEESHGADKSHESDEPKHHKHDPDVADDYDNGDYEDNVPAYDYQDNSNDYDEHQRAHKNDEDEHEGHDGHHGNGEGHHGHDEGHHGQDEGHHGHDEGHHGQDEGHHGQGDHHEGGEGQGHHEQGEGHGGKDDDEFHDATDKFDDDQGGKHKLDKRSPFVSSFFPSTDTATAKANAEADALATNVKTQADAAITSTPSTTEVSASAGASASASGGATPYASSSSSASTTTAPSVVDPNANSNSWFSWFGSSNTPTYSPYTLLQYLSPMDKSPDSLMSMFNVFSDPSNSSYLSNASTLMRVVMFFMPGTGIVDQVYFTMALSKIMWEAATMYYDGYGTTEIAVVVLSEMFEASYLSRRGEDSIISQKILTPGDTINIEGMNPPAFLKYVKNMTYPKLKEEQEEKLQKDIDNLITITYPNISSELKTTLAAGLKDTLKFLSLFNVQGDLHVDSVDVNFSSVYKNMHSAFDDSPIEKIKKTILSAIDAVKSNFT